MSQGNPKTHEGMSQGSFYGRVTFPSTHGLLLSSKAVFIIDVSEVSIKHSEITDDELLGILDDTMLPVNVTVTLDIFGDGCQLIVEKYMENSVVPFKTDFVKETEDYRPSMERAAIAWFSLDKGF